jgi:signal peptidase I
MSNLDYQLLDNDIEVFETPKDKKKKLISTIVSMVVVVVVALVTAILLKTYVICTIPVGGNSMLPTLVGGQYVMDENGKVIETVVKGDTLVLNMVAQIRSGDIVVFDIDLDDNNKSETLVKRVVAIAGDTVEINNDGKVYVNGLPIDEDYIQGATYTADLSTPLSITVPDGYVFCLGDNRENSRDSREFGPVALDSVRGKCILIASADGKLLIP